MPRLSSLTAPISTAFALLAFGGLAVGAEDEFPARPPVRGVSAAEELKTFQLPPGYRLEPVLTEPEIAEPVAIAFDGNGRMFVAEMRSYMQSIDAKDELAPTSRVSLHWSSKGDGVFDEHSVFADGLLLPRMILPLGKGQCVIGETNTLDLFLYTDADGDGVAEKKEPWFAGGPRGGNLEHQPSGLLWALDNGIYTTYDSFHRRWTPGGAIKEPSAPNGGQWGVGQDDHGHVFFMNAGGEKGPQSFQTSVVYGAFNPKEQFAPGFEEVHPLVGVADVQGGHGRHRADGTLNHFTATSGAEVYRGDRLPAELRGSLFFGEPVGRLVRRATVESKDGLTVLANPYQAEKGEFLRSTDLCFRPLNMATAPDGTLFIVDMYRGIIQEGNWVAPGSYLRKVVEQYAFDKVTGRGRIWRLVHETTKPGPAPRMLEESGPQLVAHLAHPNGWWRDAAQKLLIVRQETAAVPALLEMTRGNGNYLARLHALWTLEGLGAADAATVRTKLKDTHPQVRAAALRIGEGLVKRGDAALAPELLAMAQDADADVRVQTMLSANALKLPEAAKLTESLVATTSSAGVKAIGDLILHPPTQGTVARAYSAEDKKQLTAGAEIYNTLCTACHGPEGKGAAMAGAAPGAMMAPPLAGSKTVLGPREGGLNVLLHGLSGDIDGKKYEGLMVSMATNDDAWIANVLSFVRNSFGNRASFVAPAEVARQRALTQDRAQPWTIAELRAALPKALDRKTLKVSASANSAGAAAAIDGDLGSRYDTKISQTPGQWFQIDLPAETTVAGLELNAGKSVNDYPRGYSVQLSADGKTWGAPVAMGKGAGPLTAIEFAPAKAKSLRITQTGAVQGLFWSIHELQVFAPAAGCTMAGAAR